DRARFRLLLVEDNLPDSLMFSTLIQEYAPGVCVDVVEDGEKAVDYLMRRGAYTGAEQPDVLLLDLNLPRKGGFEVLAEIRSVPSLRRLPVFMLTTSASRDDIERARALGVIAFLT